MGFLITLEQSHVSQNTLPNVTHVMHCNTTLLSNNLSIFLCRFSYFVSYVCIRIQCAPPAHVHIGVLWRGCHNFSPVEKHVIMLICKFGICSGLFESHGTILLALHFRYVLWKHFVIRLIAFMQKTMKSLLEYVCWG